VAAVDTTGNNIALNGSDTLHDVSIDIIADCATQFGTTWTNNKITYLGGGSGVGAAQMDSNLQQIAPMSRALKNSEYCPVNSSNVATPLAAPASPGLTADLLVGIDGVAIVSNTIKSCTTGSDGLIPTAPAVGFGTQATMNTTSDGTTTGTAVGTYTFADSFDALKVLYFGLTNDGKYDCNSATRKTLVRQWKNLFAADCTSGDSSCSKGLTHAWRRSDLAGTTDAFYNILGGGALPGGKAIGTLPGVPAAAQKSNPFCNSADAVSLTGPQTSGWTVSFAGAGDFADNDPIRNLCLTSDNVCGYTGKKAGATGQGNFDGDMGIVLPILLPDGKVTTNTDNYQQGNVPCTSTCILIQPVANVLPNGYLCPDGTPNLGGSCYMPVSVAGSPICVSGQQTQCPSAVGQPDGRRYNLVTVIPATQIPLSFQPTSGNWGFAYDANANFVNGSPKYNPRFLTGDFYRIHEFTAASNRVNVPGHTDTGVGVCQENDDTSQIGCLVDADPCSIGYAGRESAALFPGAGGANSGGDKLTVKAFGISSAALGAPFTPPYTPSSANSNENEGLLNLLTTTAITTSEPFYPLSRRLYAGTLYGFGNLINGEREFEQCYTNNALLSTHITKHGFVNVPGGVQCLDYPEESLTTTTPPPNTRGAGNVAFPGCGSAYSSIVGAGNNSCTNPLTAPDICGDGVLTAVEAADGVANDGCDDGNTTDGDGCSAHCKVEPGFTCTGNHPTTCVPTGP
jgi:cysteine-rich repeat protein